MAYTNLGNVDRCYYCGREYHPMKVFTNAGAKIWVCHLEFVFDELGQFKEVKSVTVCTDAATKDGYVYRPDLTPKR